MPQLEFRQQEGNFGHQNGWLTRLANFLKNTGRGREEPAWRVKLREQIDRGEVDPALLTYAIDPYLNKAAMFNVYGPSASPAQTLWGSGLATGLGGIIEAGSYYPEPPSRKTSIYEMFTGPKTPGAIENWQTGHPWLAGIQAAGAIFPGVSVLSKAPRVSGMIARGGRATDEVGDVGIAALRGEGARSPSLEAYLASQQPRKKIKGKPKDHPTRLLREEIREIRHARVQNQPPLGAGRSLEQRLQAFKLKNRADELVTNHPNSSHWYKSERDQISQDVSLNYNPDSSLRRANLKGLVRKFKAEGWAVDHVSKEKGRVSSYYVTKGDNQVRISAHDLPMTAEREASRSIGLSGSWGDEIIVGPQTNIEQAYRSVLSDEGIGALLPAQKSVARAAATARRAGKAGRLGAEIDEGIGSLPRAAAHVAADEGIGSLPVTPPPRLGTDALNRASFIYDDAPPTVKPGSRKLIDAGEELQREALDVWGGKPMAMTDENSLIVANNMTDEARESYRRRPEMAGWYKDNLARAVKSASEIHPELGTDPEALTAFKVIMAITSNGQEVPLNAKLTNQFYTAYKKDGRFLVAGSGKEANAMKKGFENANVIVDDIGFAGFQDFLSKEFTVRDLKQAGFNVSGENMDTIVNGSIIFGPKIGGGFMQNLMGNYKPATFDRWWQRTYGRHTGTLIAAPEKVAKQRDAFRTAIGRKGKLVESFGFDIKEVMADDEVLDQFANVVHRKFASGGYKDRSPINNTSRNLGKSLTNLEDAPRGGNQRNFMRKTITQVRDNLRAEGIDIDTADVQALLWYAEKDLYGKMGARVNTARVDYATVWKEIAADHAASR